MKKKEKFEQPNDDAQSILSGIMNNSDVEEVVVRGKTWRVKDLHYFSLMKVSDIFLKEKDETKVIAKCCAVLRLDKMLFFYRLFYWIVWRWYYYIKCYTPKEMLPFLDACKKKVQQEEYAIAIIYLTGMSQTQMMMNRKEVKRILAEQRGGQPGVSPKSTTD